MRVVADLSTAGWHSCGPSKNGLCPFYRKVDRTGEPLNSYAAHRQATFLTNSDRSRHLGGHLLSFAPPTGSSGFALRAQDH